MAVRVLLNFSPIFSNFLQRYFKVSPETGNAEGKQTRIYLLSHETGIGNERATGI